MSVSTPPLRSAAMPEETPDAPPRVRPRDLLIPLTLFAASRVVNLAAAWVAFFISRLPLSQILSKWDGDWYLRIVTDGYPASVTRGDGDLAKSTLAFFPGYPAVVRAADFVLPSGPRTAGIVVNLVCAAAASVVLWFFVRKLTDADVANRATALWVFFPGSFVLSLVYSEGLFLLSAIGCLLLLHSRRWPVAGLVCAVATATRPTGLVVLACCALAAAVAVVQRRDFRALTAPVFGSLGFIAWTVYLRLHTGDALAWKYVQEHGWGQGLDFGANTVEQFERWIKHPLADVNLLVSFVVLAAVVVMVGLWAAGRWKAPAILVLFTVGILVPAVLSAQLYSTARFTMTAFPLFIATARMVKGAAFTAAVGGLAGGLALLMFLSGATFAYTP